MSVAASDGFKNLDYIDRLVWVLTWRVWAAANHEGIGFTPPAAGGKCGYFTTVDASTGQPFIAYEEGTRSAGT
jgi:hypothetical protein